MSLSIESELYVAQQESSSCKKAGAGSRLFTCDGVGSRKKLLYCGVEFGLIKKCIFQLHLYGSPKGRDRSR